MSTQLILEKYDELTSYVRRVAARWQVDTVTLDDIEQTVMLKLLEECKEREFKDAKALWGRATILARESVAETYAASLPLSGLSHQVQNAARRHLEANNGDPRTAYQNQVPTLAKVSRSVLDLVAGGSGLRDPSNLLQEQEDTREPFYALTEQQEASIMAAVNTLPEVEREVVRMYVWGDGERLTLKQVANKLGYSENRTRSAWNRARRRLKDELNALI